MSAAAERQQAIAAGDERAFRELFEKCARRYHEFTASQGAVQHRAWHFENCPAESCKSARKALGLRVNPLDNSSATKPGPVNSGHAAAEPRLREPGEEG